MPVTSGALILGAASMAALPITGAFVAKHLISDAMAAIDHPICSLLFLGGSAIATYMMFPWFALSGKSTNPKTKEVALEVQFSYVIFAFMAIGPGIYPSFLSFLMTHRPAVASSDLTSIASQLAMIICASGAFIGMLPWLKRTKGIILDMDWSYRVFIPHCLNLLNQFYTFMETKIIRRGLTYWTANKALGGRLFSESGTFTRPQSIGISAALTTAILALFLLAFYQ